MPIRKSLQFICVESYKLNYIGDVFVSLLQGHELLSLLLNITWYLCDVHCLKRDRKDSKQKEEDKTERFVSITLCLQLRNENFLVFLCLLFTPHKTTCLAHSRPSETRTALERICCLFGCIRYTRLQQRTPVKPSEVGTEWDISCVFLYPIIPTCTSDVARVKI